MPQVANPAPTSSQNVRASPRPLCRAPKHIAAARKLDRICNAFEISGVYCQVLPMVASPICRATTTQKTAASLRGIAIPLKTQNYCRTASVINLSWRQNRLAASVCRGGDKPQLVMIGDTMTQNAQSDEAYVAAAF